MASLRASGDAPDGDIAPPPLLFSLRTDGRTPRRRGPSARASASHQLPPRRRHSAAKATSPRCRPEWLWRRPLSRRPGPSVPAACWSADLTARDATGRTWRRSATVTAGGMAAVPIPLLLPPRSGGRASRTPTASPIIYGSSLTPDTCSSASADRQLSGLPWRRFGHRATLLVAASPRRRCSSHYELTAEPREGRDVSVTFHLRAVYL